MLHIKFKYRDALSKGEWRTQECLVNSLQECINFYGLGIDCDYKIISIEEVFYARGDLERHSWV